MRIMVSKDIGRIPVVDNEGIIKGIIDRAVISRLLVKEKFITKLALR